MNQSLNRSIAIPGKSASLMWWVLFIAFHIPLTLLMQRYEIIATAHAWAVLFAAGFIVLSVHEPKKIAWAAAYIVGAEVLWRMNDAQIFYEVGKYAVVAILGIGYLRMPKRQGIGLPLAYIFLMFLSIPLTMFGMDLNQARMIISGNISGPICLAVAVIFFSQMTLSLEDRKSLALFLVAPLVGVSTNILYSIQRAEEIVFTDESNFITSAGFGPNQVSAILGLGALLLIILAIQDRKIRWPSILLGLGLLTLSVLTFSRGGLYNVVAALLCTSAVFIRDRRLRGSFLGLSIIALLIGGFFIYPRLNEFTGGMMTARFSDTNTTNRMEIMRAEFDVWLANPILGSGPGMGKFERYSQLGFLTASHTEYTRMVAEHGIPGLIGIFLLLAMAFGAVRRAPPGLIQAWTVAMLAWPLMEMTHAAMRIAAIGFIFGLAMVGHAEAQPEE